MSTNDPAVEAAYTRLRHKDIPHSTIEYVVELARPVIAKEVREEIAAQLEDGILKMDGPYAAGWLRGFADTLRLKP